MGEQNRARDAEGAAVVPVTFADSLQGVDSAEENETPLAQELERGNKLDRYVIVDELGKGGMGVVYAAYDPELDRKVAVKLLRTDSVTARARLMREAKAVARLNHPNVVTVHDVGTVGGRVFVAMQLIEGVTLRQWLHSRAPGWRETLRVVRDAGRGLAAAHAAGLVHRDFKPENILVDRRDHATVLDFGIARRADTGTHPDRDAVGMTEPAAASPPEPAGSLTRADTIMGTPAYMAPEQHAKDPTDARSDQFSFCVVAWEALYGQRPFAGDTAQAIAESVLAGRVREPPSDVRVPGWVRRVLVRGLSREPDARHLSMERLLAQLERDPGSARLRWGMALGVASLAGIGLFAGLRGESPATDPCAGAEQRLEGVWDEAVRTEIADAFAATGVPYATNAFAAVSGELDAWRTQWVAAHDDACHATHHLHEQSAKMLDLRMACLNRRLGEVSALTQMFRGADSRVLQNSVVAVKSLGRVEACSDVEFLVARVDPPADPDVRDQVAVLHDRLSDARALELGGRYDEALREATEVEERAQALAYLPLEAEANERLGAIWQAKGDYERSEAHLLRAIWAAEESRAEEVAADAWNRLVWVVGVEQFEPEQGRQWAQFARAALHRLGEDRFREATLTHNLGGVFYRQGDYEQAFAHYEAALQAQMEILGPEDPAVGRTLNHLGNVLIEKGDLERAFEYCEKSLRVRENVLGGRHPLVAASLNNMAAIRLRQARGDEALAFVDRAREIVGGSEGPEELVASVLAGRILHSLERDEEASEAFRRVVELREALYGPEDARLIADLRELAGALERAEKEEEAARVRERADAIDAAHAAERAGEGRKK